MYDLVIFDLDGTLYKSKLLKWKLMYSCRKNLHYLRALQKVRRANLEDLEIKVGKKHLVFWLNGLMKESRKSPPMVSGRVSTEPVEGLETKLSALESELFDRFFDTN